jgi:hypothetical protein
MTVHGGASVVLTAATGIYQSQAQLLDLFADVNLIHENGTRFVTQHAHINLSDDSAEGHDPIEGHGPSGDITGQGFRVLSKGETIIFTGGSHLLFKGTKPSSTLAEPAALPAPVESAAARIEAAVAVPAVALSASHPRGSALAIPTQGERAATPKAPVKPQLNTKHGRGSPVHDKRAPTKVAHAI